MLIKRITHGYVEQVYDTEKKCWVSQSFTCGDDSVYKKNGTDESMIHHHNILLTLEEIDNFEQDAGYLPYKVTCLII